LFAAEDSTAGSLLGPFAVARVFVCCSERNKPFTVERNKPFTVERNEPFTVASRYKME
jgi:hypothetical protein